MLLRLAIVSSHDSSVSCHISFIHFRMFCFNQMNKLKQSNPLIFKHTKSINDNVKNINRIIDFKKGEFTKSIEDYKLMVRKEIKEEFKGHRNTLLRKNYLSQSNEDLEDAVKGSMGAL